MTGQVGMDFWTRRKAAVKSEAEREAVAAKVAEDRGQDERPDEEILDELGLQDPDTLKAGDDFSAFMKSAVPGRIRNRALRKLWVSNPVLANLDELLDYGEDFTDKATVIENLQTTYQVGKGMLEHVLATEKTGTGRRRRVGSGFLGRGIRGRGWHDPG